MKLVQLKYFLAVCKHNNFTLAANEYYVSQPAISSAVRDLEEEYGIRLFNRQKKWLELTEEGRWLKERAEFLLRYVTATEKQLQVFSQNKKFLRVGATPMIGMLSFFSIFDQFRKTCQDVHIDLMEAGSLQVRQWIEDGVVDIGVLLVDELSLEQFEMIHLFQTELIFCVHHSHPLAGRSTIPFEALAGQSVLLLKEDSYQNKLIKDEMLKRHVDIDILTYSSQISSILNLLSYGNCGAFLFRQLVANTQGFCAISMQDKMSLTAGLAWKKTK